MNYAEMAINNFLNKEFSLDNSGTIISMELVKDKMLTTQEENVLVTFVPKISGIIRTINFKFTDNHTVRGNVIIKIYNGEEIMTEKILSYPRDDIVSFNVSAFNQYKITASYTKEIVGNVIINLVTLNTNIIDKPNQYILIE